MLAGQSSSVAIEDITVRRDERIRKSLDPKRVAELAESISRIGLIHFPVVTSELVLVAGETRLEACKSLGWTHIPVQFKESLAETELLEIELEENIKRTDLTWQEQVDSLQSYHKLKLGLFPDWTASRTAESLGVTPAMVSDYLAIGRAVAKGDARVIAAPKISVAKNIVKRQAERRAADMENLILEANDVLLPSTPFVQGDFNTWAPSYAGPPFNVLHCDFPYGIEADTFNQGASDKFGGYADTFDTYSTLLDTLFSSRENLLGSSAHIIFWFSMKHYQYTLDRLKEFFWVDPYPLIWVKSDNKGTLPDPTRGPRRIYETAFLCSFGDRKIVQAKSNTFSGPTSREGQHMSEKSEDMLVHFLSMLVDENTRFLDPTAGSGSSLRAARRLGVKSLLGLEQNPEFVQNAIEAWNK